MPNFDMNQIMRMMGGNPSQFLQHQMQQNPKIAQIQSQLYNMQKSSGMSSKDFAMQYAKQNGIPTQQLEALANMLGVK